jgi:signal transduction histidine kinase
VTKPDDKTTGGQPEGNIRDLAGGDSLAREDLEKLIAAIGRISGLLDSSVIANKAAQEARALTGVDLVGIAVVEGDNSIVMIGTSGVESEWYSRLRLSVDIGQGFAGTILATRLPLFVNMLDLNGGVVSYDAVDGSMSEPLLDPAYATHLRQRMLPEHLNEYIGIPIELNDEVLGLLYAGNRGAKPTPKKSRILLARFSAMIAPALSSARRARDAAVNDLARERERIAQGLHDTIGQILFGIGTVAKRAQGRDLGPDTVVADDLRLIELEASRAAAHLREVLRAISDVPSESALEVEARILAGMFTQRTGTPAEVIVSGTSRALKPDELSTLVAVVREGLHNVEKHAAASTAVVMVHFAVREVTVVVQDDGRGVPAKLKIPTAGRQNGLASLNRRLERVGGSLEVARSDDSGTRLKAVI